MTETIQVRELKIPVPWGHIAAKAWGCKDNIPVLVFHGRMDNAGAFDHLIPLLPDTYQYICIDFPSHGKSSHFPPHLPIYSLNYLLVYKLVMNYFNRSSYDIIGHSYGGQLGLLYARLYPESVEKLVMIDTVHLEVVAAEDYTSYMRRKLDVHFKLMDKLAKGTPPKYSYKEACERISTARETENLSENAARALLNRGLEPVAEKKYTFTLDQRMKDYLDQTHDIRYAVESLQHDPVQCPVLMILSELNRRFTDAYQPITNALKAQGNVEVRRVDAGHDVHNTQPEKIAPMISKFLLKKDLQNFQPSGKTMMNKSLGILKWLRFFK